MTKTHILLLSLATASAQAATNIETWDGGGTADAWGQGANWADNNFLEGNETDVVYTTVGATDTATNYLGANREIRSISYNTNFTGAHTLQFSSLPAGEVNRDLSFSALSGNSTVTLDAGASQVNWQVGASDDANGDADAILNNNLDIIHNGAQVFRTYVDIVDGIGSNKVTKSGTGAFHLRGNNTFAGGLEIEAGSVNTFFSDGVNDALSSGAITFSGAASSDAILTVSEAGSETITNNIVLDDGGGTLSVGNAAGNATFSGVISGTGDLRKIGNGAITLSGENTFNGDIDNQNSGTIFLASTGELTFEIGASGVNNGFIGAATSSLVLDGTFSFDLIGAGTGATDEWTIIASELLANTDFGENFSVDGFTEDSGIWSDGTYEFSEITGDLSVVPEPSNIALLGGLLALCWVAIRRRA